MKAPTHDHDAPRSSTGSGPEPEGVDRLTAQRVRSAWLRARGYLLCERTDQGHWLGQLSTSALSTATAISALALTRKHRTQSYLERGEEIDAAIVTACHWLQSDQNADGGFGDTPLSHSNIATSLLVLAAWQLAGFQGAHQATQRAWQYCDRIGKWDALRRRYGKDKTFVAPILTNCALAGIVSWDEVPTLPFEAAWLPQSWYRLARMPVVSYAIPALVAIGQAKFHHRPPAGPLRAVRRAAIEPTLRVLARMQPSSGGYLEAVPLTSFVLMCLADIGLGDHPVAARAVDFLLASRLRDGSLPIDTNLATWTTSLSISALENARADVAASKTDAAADVDADANSNSNANSLSKEGAAPWETSPEHRGMVRSERVSPLIQQAVNAAPDEKDPVTPTAVRWLLSCQHWSEHPFTGAKPGGWGWSNLSGAVPDADDTPAALLALARWSEAHRGESSILDMQIASAATQGLRWLLGLQNRDGGWPTFCRGWGALPFDRSGCDLTAHALRAVAAWSERREWLEHDRAAAIMTAGKQATERGFRFLAKRQNPDGSWFPLWFGNQDRADEENPVYGTAKVLLAYADCQREDTSAERGVAYLIEHQNADGGWGGGISVPYRVPGVGRSEHGSSVEETGYALEALLAAAGLARGSTEACQATIMRGLRWMVAAVEDDCLLTSWPIGFYFAKLWYHERLYPIIASTSALGAAVERTELWLESP